MNSKGLNNALKLFQEVASTSKAYQLFLASKKINRTHIINSSHFQNVPVMDKENYINKYSLHDRLFEGKKMEDFYMLCSSSGSTAKPTFWPRDIKIDAFLERKKEELYEQHFNISKKTTLCIVTLALGSWTGGMLSAKLSWGAANNNKFTVITPGINKETTYQLISELYHYYDQIVVLGYPPFLTDLIEYSLKQSKDLSKYNIKLLCTGERFSEQWRTGTVAQISRHKKREDVVSFYACSDTGIIGAETKFSIRLLGEALHKGKLAHDLFGTKEIPTLVAYDSDAKYLECIDNEILITARQPVPLLRYNIHDRGGLLTREDITKICLKHNIHYTDNELDDNYVYVFGRSDSIQITANIYIEDIKYCLENSKYKHRFTGYFRYGKEQISNLRYRLKVIIYTKENVVFTRHEEEEFQEEFYRNLLSANDDFRAIQQGTKIEKFNLIFQYHKNPSSDSIKVKYFL